MKELRDFFDDIKMLTDYNGQFVRGFHDGISQLMRCLRENKDLRDIFRANMGTPTFHRQMKKYNMRSKI